MSRPPLCSAQAAKYDSVLDVEQTFAAIFCTLKHDFVELQQLSSYDQMLSTIRELNLSPDQHNTSTYDTRINGVAMAVGAFVAYLERVVGASGIESCPNWQAMLWGSMTILLKVHRTLDYCVEQALHLIELLTSNLLRFHAAKAQCIPCAESAKGNMLQILAEIVCTLGEAIVSLRTKPSQQKRPNAHKVVYKVDISEVERIQRASDRIAMYTDVTLTDSKGTALTASLESLNLPFNNTTDDMLSKRFFGRDAYLPRIKIALAHKGRNRNFHLTLHGLPGVGKTQLALRYIQKYQHDYEVIILAAAVTEQKIRESFARAAYGMHLPGSELSVNLEERVQNLLSWLEKTDKRWLIVYDNVDDVAILDAFKVPSDYGHVLITSRDPRTAERGILVSAFSPEDSRAFFFNNIGVQNMVRVPEKLEKWFQEWDGLPMALDQMGSYVRESKLTLQAFSAMYEDHRPEVHSMHETYAREWGYHNTTATAFSIRTLQDEPRTLLHSMCFLDPDKIYDESRLYGDHDEQSVLLNIFKHQISYFKAVDELFKRSLIQKGANSLKVHRLVQAVSFDDMGEDQRHVVFQKLLGLISAAYPQNIMGSSLLKYWAPCDRYYSHVGYLLDHRNFIIHGPTCNEDADLRKLISTCTWYMFERGYFSEADRLLRDANTLLAGDDVLAASLRFSLAGIRNECNRVAEARVLINEVVAIQERVLQPNDLTLGNTYYSAGIVHMECGDLKAAFDFHHKALKVQKLAGDIDKTQAAATHANMSYCFLRAKDTCKAAEHAEKAYDLSLEACGEHSDHFAEALFCLGNVRLVQGRSSEAFRLHQQSLECRMAVMPLHDKTGYSLHKVATLYESQGNLNEALNKLVEAISIFESNFDHVPRVARSRFKQAQVLEKLGRTAESLQVRKDASRMRDSIKTFPVGVEETEQTYDALICSWFR